MSGPVLDTATPVLEIENLSKTFPGTVALDQASLTIAEGQIHALVGQNGSGKSTLVKILAGYHRADPGYTARLNGEELDLHRAAVVSRDRLRFVHQDLGLFLELSATDNLALRGEFLRGPTGLVSWRKQAKLTRELLHQFDIDLDLRTIVAIAAALADWAGGPGVLVLDEPTAVLPPPEVDRLLATVEQLRRRGTSVLYVSHRLDEVFRVADTVTVLRGGRVVASRPVAGLDTQSLAQLMVGSEVDAGYRAGLEHPASAPVVLRARNMTGQFLRGLGVELRAGEILGLAGLPGSGSTELAYALAGAGQGVSGEVALSDGQWRPARKAASFDIPIVPADRAAEAVVG
jgi:ABC-type sugar transport system ATPase subunit